MTRYLLSFDSTHAALAAQRVFKDAKVAFVLIPTPREISAGCGMTLSFEASGKIPLELPRDVYEACTLYEETSTGQINAASLWIFRAE